MLYNVERLIKENGLTEKEKNGLVAWCNDSVKRIKEMKLKGYDVVMKKGNAVKYEHLVLMVKKEELKTVKPTVYDLSKSSRNNCKIK